MGPPQWADRGMFLQSLMLVARHLGLHTCSQETWGQWFVTTAKHLDPPDELMLFCGVALATLTQGQTENLEINISIAASANLRAITPEHEILDAGVLQQSSHHFCVIQSGTKEFKHDHDLLCHHRLVAIRPSQHIELRIETRN